MRSAAELIDRGGIRTPRFFDSLHRGCGTVTEGPFLDLHREIDRCSELKGDPFDLEQARIVVGPPPLDSVERAKDSE
jgi:hypothetical protein